MHISDGVLSVPVLAGGGALAAGGVVVGLRNMDYERIPQVAILSSAFFVASLVHVKIGPSSAHLVLNGLVGLLLGWAAFPAMLVALFLQAVLLQHGGITTLGVNTVTMATPAVLCYFAFHRGVCRGGGTRAAVSGFLAGSLGVLLGAVLAAAALLTTGEEFANLVPPFLAIHLPIAVIEGVMTASVVGFLRRVRPEMLDAPLVRRR